MVGGPQRRLLPRRPGEAGAAADSRPAVRLPDDQRRGAGARPAFAAQLDAPPARRAQPAEGLRPRQPEDARAEQPTDPRLPARIRRGRTAGQHPLRGQPVARGPGGGTGPRQPCRQGAGGDDRRHVVPADRRADLPADPAALRLLLVLPGRRDADAELARGRRRAPAGTADPGGQAAPRRAAAGRIAEHPGRRDTAGLPAEAPLVRRRERPATALLHRSAGRGGAALCAVRSGDRRAALPVAAGLPRRRPARRQPASVAGPGAPAARAQGRPADRRRQPAAVRPQGPRATPRRGGDRRSRWSSPTARSASASAWSSRCCARSFRGCTRKSRSAAT